MGAHKLWSKLEIDPATMGDQGIYSCVANNVRGVMAKNFKAEYTYWFVWNMWKQRSTDIIFALTN